MRKHFFGLEAFHNKIIVGFGVVCLVLAIQMTTFYLNFAQFISVLELRNDHIQVRMNTRVLRMRLLALESELWKFAANPTPNNIPKLEKRIEDVETSRAHLNHLAHTSKDDDIRKYVSTRFDPISEQIQGKTKVLQDFLNSHYRQNGKLSASNYSAQDITSHIHVFFNQFDPITKGLDAIIKAESTEVEKKYWQIQHGVERTFLITMVGTALILGLLILVYKVITHENKRRSEAERQIAILNEELQTRFAATFEQMAVGILHFTPEHEWIRYNDKLRQMLDIPSDMEDHPTCSDIVAPEDYDKFAEALTTVQQGEANHVSTEVRMLSLNGRRFWANITFSSIYKPDGTLQFYVAVLEDITARKETELAYLESEAKYRRIAESNMIGVFFWNIDGNIHQANSAFLSIIGYSQEEVAAGILSWRSITPEDYMDQDNQVLGDMLITGVCKPFEKQYIHKSGHRVDVLIGAAFLDDTHTLGVAYCIDQSQRKKLEKRLAQANQELEAFSYSVSHDLKAPLRRIEGFSQMLLTNNSSPEESKQFLQRISANALTMKDLIDDLLSFSRIARSTLCMEPLNLSAMAQEIIADLQESEPHRHVSIHIQPNLFTQGDASLMRVVLSNLLGNAWKFTSKTPTPVIELGSALEGGELLFYVRDNGAGFDPAHSDELFKPFSRLHSDQEFAGTGIGLANVQRIIHRHDGDVWAEGKPGQGATFKFTLQTKASALFLERATTVLT